MYHDTSVLDDDGLEEDVGDYLSPCREAEILEPNWTKINGFVSRLSKRRGRNREVSQVQMNVLGTQPPRVPTTYQFSVV